MALTDGNGNGGMVMPVTPMYGGGYGGGLGGFGGDWWGILLLIALLNGGYGFGGFGGGMWPMMMMGGVGMMDGMGLYPWLNNSQNINGGFQNQMLNSTANGIRDGVTALGTQIGAASSNIQQSLCNGFAGINSALSGGFAAAEASAANRQMASMQQNFAAQTAVTQGLNQIASQQADFCCESRAGIADLKYTVATENCADRSAAAQNTRDIIDAQTRGTQAILDKLCALELDGVKNQLAAANREILGLQNQVNLATERADRTAQTAQILAGQAAEIDGVYNRLKNCPVGTYSVCNPNIYPGQNNCGCNGGFVG